MQIQLVDKEKLLGFIEVRKEVLISNDDVFKNPIIEELNFLIEIIKKNKFDIDNFENQLTNYINEEIKRANAFLRLDLPREKRNNAEGYLKAFQNIKSFCMNDFGDSGVDSDTLKGSKFSS